MRSLFDTTVIMLLCITLSLITGSLHQSLQKSINGIKTCYFNLIAVNFKLSRSNRFIGSDCLEQSTKRPQALNLPIIIISCALLPMYSFADYSPKYLTALENVERVSQSLNYIQEDINQNGDAESIISQIKYLLKNYKMKENIQTAIESLPESSRKTAKEHGQQAFEDLTQIYEYYLDEIDNFTGKKFPPKEVLMFATQATVASQNELKEFFKIFPSDVVNEVHNKVTSEYNIKNE